MTISIMGLFETLNRTTLSTNNTQLSSIECHYAKCRVFMLSVVILSVTMLNVIMLNAVTPYFNTICAELNILTAMKTVL
jgi:hypothetical protein